MLLYSQVRSFRQWVAVNCTMPPTATAGQYATSQCKPLLFGFPCKRQYVNAYRCFHGLAPPYLSKEQEPVSTRAWHTVTTAISHHQRPRRSADSSFHRRWSGFPCCRSSGVEQPASLGYISSNPQHVQAAAKNWTFHSLLRSAVFLCTQTFCLILSYCCTTRSYFFSF